MALILSSMTIVIGTFISETSCPRQAAGCGFVAGPTPWRVPRGCPVAPWSAQIKNKITLNQTVILLIVKVNPQLAPDWTEIRPGAAGVWLVSEEDQGAREAALGAGWGDYWSSAVKRLRPVRARRGSIMEVVAGFERSMADQGSAKKMYEGVRYNPITLH